MGQGSRSLRPPMVDDRQCYTATAHPRSKTWNLVNLKVHVRRWERCLSHPHSRHQRPRKANGQLGRRWIRTTHHCVKTTLIFKFTSVRKKKRTVVGCATFFGFDIGNNDVVIIWIGGASVSGENGGTGSHSYDQVKKGLYTWFDMFHLCIVTA